MGQPPQPPPQPPPEPFICRTTLTGSLVCFVFVLLVVQLKQNARIEEVELAVGRVGLFEGRLALVESQMHTHP